MSDRKHQLIMLKPMRAGLSGYARVQAGVGETLLQINARGLKPGEMRVFWYHGGGEARELGRARVNSRGEASLTSETPGSLIAPERLQALLIMDGSDEPDPLLIGLCVQQSAGSLLDAKNALLALCEKFSRHAQDRRSREIPVELKPVVLTAKAQPAAPPPPTIAPQAIALASIAPPLEESPRLHEAKQPARQPDFPPREIFLPAIDPMFYIVADEAPVSKSDSAAAPAGPESPCEPPPPRRDGIPADRLRPLVWPGAFIRLKPYFDTCMPQRLFDLPGWRFVHVRENGLWIGFSQQDGRVKHIAYAFPGEHPPQDGRPYRARRGLDGILYQVLWQKTEA